MDDDDLRRGRPTCHKVYGEAIAILAGDGLLTMAFEALSDPRRLKAIPAPRLLAIIREIATASGVFGMVGGQVVDIQSEGKEMDLPTLEYIHTHKTGALIRASVRVGAFYAGAGERQFAALSRYGNSWGWLSRSPTTSLTLRARRKRSGKMSGATWKKAR